MNAPGNALQPVAGTELSLTIGTGPEAIAGDTLKVYRVRGHEAISEPFRYEIELERAGGNLSFRQVLDQDATLRIEVTDGGLMMERKIHGVVDEFMVEESVDDADDTEHRYRVVLVPRLAMLARNRQNRIHATSEPAQTLGEIIRHKLLSTGPDYGTDERSKRVVLAADEFRIDIDNAKVPLTSLSHVAQYDETDLDFIRRLCERHGVHFFFASNAGDSGRAEDTAGMVVFANTDEPFGVIRFRTEAAGDGYENEHRLDIDLTLQGTTGLTGRWTRASFDPGSSDDPDDDTITTLKGVLEEFRSVRRPTPANLHMATAGREAGAGPMAALDGEVLGIHTARGIYTDYDTHVPTRIAGDAFAGIRSQELRTASNYFVGSTSSPCVAPGRTFTKKKLPEGSSAEDRKYLVTAVDIEVTHAHAGGISEIDGEVIQTAFGNRFWCIESEQDGSFAFRPPRETPVPRVHGVQTAYIGTGATGPGGRPDPDADGAYRIYSRFVDERARFVDPDYEAGGASNPASADRLEIDSLSKAVRKGEPYAGESVGMHFPLKRDTEVLVAYRNGDPDQPVIAVAMPGSPNHESPVTDANPTSHVVTTSSGARFEIHDDMDSDGGDSGGGESGGADSRSRIALRSRAADDKASYVRLGGPDTTNQGVPETLEDRYETSAATVAEEDRDGIALYTADHIREATQKDRLTEAKGSVRVQAEKDIHGRSVQRHLLRGRPMVIVSGEEVDEPDAGDTVALGDKEVSLGRDDMLLSSKGNVYITAGEDIRTTALSSVTTVVEADVIRRTSGDTVSHHYGTTYRHERGSSNSAVLGASTNARVGLAALAVYGGWLRPWGPVSLRMYFGAAYYLWPHLFILQGTVTLTNTAVEYKSAGAIVRKTSMSRKAGLIRHRLAATNVENAGNVSILGVEYKIL